MLMRIIFRKYCKKTQNEDKGNMGVGKKKNVEFNVNFLFSQFSVRIETFLLYKKA